MVHKLKAFVISVVLLAVTSTAFSEPDIFVLWEKEISQVGRSIKPYAIKVAEDKNVIRIIGASYRYRSKETPRLQAPELFEYRLDLRDNTSEFKTLKAMDDGDKSISLPRGGVIDSRLIGDKIVMIRSKYKSFDFPELTIGNDGQVKSRDILGLTRRSVSTHGACRNMNGDVFLCGNGGYIRKIKSDGTVAWDTNYKSDKGEDGTFGVAFSESKKMLVAFGFSFEPDTKFTTKNSSLWLANLGSDGDFKARTEFEGITDFGKVPSFCLSKSDNPIVIYDNSAETKSYKIYVSKFSKDLNTKVWTTLLFDKKDTMVLPMVLTAFEDGRTLATFISMTGRKIDLHLYVLGENGSIANRGIVEDIKFAEYLAAVVNDRIFLLTEGVRLGKDSDTEAAKLICYKISLFRMQ